MPYDRSFEDDPKMMTDTESHISNDSIRHEPYELQAITSGRSSIGSRSAQDSINRIKSNNSELSRIITAIRDDHQQDHEEFQRYRDDVDLDRILDTQLDRTSRRSVADEENKIEQRDSYEKDASADEEEGETRDKEDIDEPPDGGYGWVAAFCAMMAAFSTWGANAGYGVFLNYYLSSNTFPGGGAYDYALIGGIVVFLAQVLAPFSALAYKILGFYTLCFIGIFLQTCGYILASFATKLWQIYLTQGVLVGISFLLIFIPPTLILPQYFKKYRAFAMGIAVSGAGLGGIVFALSTSKLIQETGDQRWALRMTGFVTLTLALIATILNKPRNYNPMPYSITLKKKFIIDNFKLIFDIKIFKSYPLVLVSLWFLLCLLGYTLMLFSMAAYSTLVGLSAHDASTVTALLNVGQVFGRPSLGLIADRVGRNNLAASISLLISILLWAFWINATSFPAVSVFAIILGFFIGIGSLMCQSLAADIIQAPEKIPAAWSIINIIVLFFCLVAEVIALAIRDESSDRPFLNTQIFSGCCFFAAFLLLLIDREWLVRRTLNNRLLAAQSGILCLEKKRRRYLNTDDLQQDEAENNNSIAELELLEERIMKYEKLLHKSAIYFFIRMLYPIRV
ncbi:unnamed protein product [Debaryomyces tyrocola]|nr:unnamed protein product [Debaryomyces tyrocola]